MGFTEFLTLQIIAHILADYFFQTDALATDKNHKGFRSKFLVWHTLIVFALSWLLSFQLKFFVGAGIIAITHYLIDGFKPKLNRSKMLGLYAFFIDQGLHILILAAVAWFYNDYHGLYFYWEPPIEARTYFVILAYMLCLKPANIIIKEIFSVSKIDVALSAKDEQNKESHSHELPNAGKLIGILERLLTLTFILLGQYQAVGFLIAAKSVLRYKDTDTLKTEYVLIGTMLSFGIAVGLGALVMI